MKLSHSHLQISSHNKEIWLREITEISKHISDKLFDNREIILVLPQSLNSKNIEPVHIVTLACLVKQFQKSKVRGGKIQGNSDLISYLRNELDFSDHFSPNNSGLSKINYTDTLWNVSVSYSEGYSQYVSKYLQRKYFNNRDVSGLKVVLDELFANIADHAKADDIAYSLIKFNENKKSVEVAFCDFGLGIKKSLADAGKLPEKGYIEYAVRKGVTSGNNSHNRGYGLDTVVSSISQSGNLIRIISGNEFFISYGNGKNFKTFSLSFSFHGTLIYFEIPISSFEELDILNDFEI